MSDSVEALRWGFPSAGSGFPLTSLLSETSCLKELEHAGQQDWKWWFTVLRLAGGGSEEAVSKACPASVTLRENRLFLFFSPGVLGKEIC